MVRIIELENGLKIEIDPNCERLPFDGSEIIAGETRVRQRTGHLSIPVIPDS
jgi:hypothetical protein